MPSDTPYTPAGPWAPTHPTSPKCTPDTPTPPDGPNTQYQPQCLPDVLISLLVFNCHFATDHLHEYVQFTIYCLPFNCHHFATDCLHKYVQFAIYHLEESRVHLQCCEAQPISAISPKTCTLKLQLLCNTERPTKWSGHGKMIDLPGELLHTKDLLPKRVAIKFNSVLFLHTCLGNRGVPWFWVHFLQFIVSIHFMYKYAVLYFI